MKFSRTSTGSFRSKLYSFRKKFHNLFHHHQVTNKVSNQPQEMIELALTIDAFPLPMCSDKQAGKALSTSSSLQATIGTAASALPTLLSQCATFETPATTIAVETNDKENTNVTPLLHDSLFEKALLVIFEYTDYQTESKKAKSMATETKDEKNVCSLEAIKLKAPLEHCQDAFNVSCPLIEPPAAFLIVEPKEMVADQVIEEVPLWPTTPPLLFPEYLLNSRLNSAGLERIISGDLYQSASCISPGLSEYSSGSEAYYLGKITRQFLRSYQHPKQVRKRTQTVVKTNTNFEEDFQVLY
ncbi:uncharacterized protein KQ657_001345 [Scheffersomyces spartinae]|uniref:Uncharacterized protein n=1 Tax=Scheffersomyces spartinae TaxID=45513 RepID=A0A9P7V899_9ASCO|nr:uncharacterized protein KQ657_001345 [Scheffersomyces spartinae]KAG7192888.1 hypothetical protein KQ657_001345 [Scheffersomyces spartinae]